MLCLVPRAGAEEGGDGLPLWFFYHPGCGHCVDALRAMRAAQAHFGEAIALTRIDTSRGDGAARMMAMLDQYGWEGLVIEPLNLFSPRQHLAGGPAIIAGWQEMISAELENPEALGPLRRRAGEEDAASRRLGWLAISLAALADSVNPCAFATIVMLISLLVASGRPRGEVLSGGLGFAAGVFVAYLAIGLLLYGVLQQLRHLYLLSDLISWLAFTICIVGALVCCWDASLSWRQRRAGEMLLKVPKRLRHRMTSLMRQGLSARSICAGAFVAGALVSLIESLCTGAVYFPVIAGLVHSGNVEALIKLLWYNLLFILPILLIVIGAYFGMGSQTLAGWGNRWWGLTKFLLALVFLLMAWWLWQGLNWPPGDRAGASSSAAAEPLGVTR